VCQFAFSVMLTAVLCMGSVLRPSVVNATVYYVATTGNNNNSCSTAQNISTPKRNIAGASGGFSCLTPGDTLYIRQGTYTDQIDPAYNTIPIGGPSWANAITIAGYPGEVVTISDGIAIQDNLNLSIVAYLIFDNFTTPVLWIGGNSHHIRFSNCDVPGAPSANNIMTQSTTSYIEVLKCRVHNAPVGASSAYGFYIAGHNHLFDGNTVYNNTGSAFCLYHSGSSDVHDNIVRNNLIYGNAYDDGARNNDNAALLLASGDNNQAYNNILYGNGNINHANAGGGGGGGLGVSYGCTNCKIYNNTIYGNVGIGLSITNSPNTDMKNNIIFGNGINRIVDWGGSAGSTSTTNLCGDNTGMSCILTTNLKFVNAASNDFHLQASSPTIDAGTTVSVVTTDFDGVSRPQGSAYDIGAYEYKGTTLSAPDNLHIVSQ